MADNRDSGARRALPGEGTGMSGVVELAEQLAVAVKALREAREALDLAYSPQLGRCQCDLHPVDVFDRVVPAHLLGEAA